MPLLALPFLAQALSLQGGDRLEVRALKAEAVYGQIEDRAALEGVARWRNGSLGAIYAPSVLMSTDTRGAVSIFHRAAVDARASYITERTSYTLANTLSYSVTSLANDLFSGGTTAVQTAPTKTATPPPATGTPGTPTTPTAPATPAAEGKAAPANPAVPVGLHTDTYWSEHIAGTVTHGLSRRLRFASLLAYDVGGGVGTVSRRNIPLVHRPQALLSLEAKLDIRDSATTYVGGEGAFGSDGDSGAILGAGERFSRIFSPRTSGTIGGGATLGHSDTAHSRPGDVVYPTAYAALTHVDRLGRGDVSENVTLTYAPIIDRLSLTVNPTIGAHGAVTWADRYVTLGANAGTDLAVYPQRYGSYSIAAANGFAIFRLGKSFSVETGMRAIWSSYSGQTNIPFTGVVYAAVQWTSGPPPP